MALAPRHATAHARMPEGGARGRWDAMWKVVAEPGVEAGDDGMTDVLSHHVISPNSGSPAPARQRPGARDVLHPQRERAPPKSGHG
eukprot:4008622-Prymnesium_polylepis.1